MNKPVNGEERGIVRGIERERERTVTACTAAAANEIHEGQNSDRP